MFNKILLTGADGHMGKRLRPKICQLFSSVRSSHRRAFDAVAPNEEINLCELSDAQSVDAMVQGCDGIIHLGGVSTENTFENILNGNIIGVYNLYESARKHNVKRILFASSNHAIGFYDVNQRIDADAPPRPDSMYGVSKGYGELLARYYYEKYGIETVAVRIGSCWEQPKDNRMLKTWLSDDDFASLVDCIFKAPKVGYCVVYGVSNNEETWWDNSKVDFLGWHPKDSSAQFASLEHIKNEIIDPHDEKHQYQGGAFATAGHFED